MLKISEKSLVLRTREFTDFFITFDEIYLVFTSKKYISSMYLYFQFDSICVFSELFELVSALTKQFYAFQAYILLLHVSSLRVTLTRVRMRVTHFTHSHLRGYSKLTNKNKRQHDLN